MNRASDTSEPGCLGACRRSSQSSGRGRNQAGWPRLGAWAVRFNSAVRSNDRSAPDVTVEGAVDSGAVAFEADGASLLVAVPDLAKRSEFLAIQGGLFARGTEDHAHVVAAGPVDRVPERA